MQPQAQPVRNHPITTDLQAQFELQHNAGWSDLTAGIVFGQAEIDEFCRITGDTNRIHAKDQPYPVVPGLLLLSALPRYLDGKLPLIVEGHETVIEHIVPRFVNFVGVGKPVGMQYLAAEMHKDDNGPKVFYDFQIREVGKNSNAVVGRITLRFVQSRLYAALVKRACGSIVRQ